MSDDIKIEIELNNPEEDKNAWWESIPILNMIFRYKAKDKTEEFYEDIS